MSSVNLSKEQSEIKGLLEKYGCLDIAQAYALFDPLSRETVDSMIDMMVRTKIISIIDSHVLVLNGDTQISLNSLSCLWAMLKVSTNKDEVTHSFLASEPAFSYMIVGNQDSYIFVNVKADETVKVRAIQEKIEKGKKNKHFKDTYIFVTTDEKVKKVIKDTDFMSTVYIAYLNYDKKTKIPDVKLLKKSAA